MQAKTDTVLSNKFIFVSTILANKTCGSPKLCFAVNRRSRYIHLVQAPEAIISNCLSEWASFFYNKDTGFLLTCLTSYREEILDMQKKKKTKKESASASALLEKQKFQVSSVEAAFNIL